MANSFVTFYDSYCNNTKADETVSGSVYHSKADYGKPHPSSYSNFDSKAKSTQPNTHTCRSNSSTGDQETNNSSFNIVFNTVFNATQVRSRSGHCDAAIADYLTYSASYGEGGNSHWEAPETPQKLQLLQRESERQFSRQSSLTNSIRGSMTDDDIVNDLNCGDCGICGSTLCGVANGSSSSLTISSSDNDSNRSINSNGSNGGVFTPPWLGNQKKNGSGSANSFSGSRRSASRRRAATYYLTTLSCGHQFHDECIVPKLNESLECPTCGRIQTNN
ncbi:hypothetical protein AM587_10015652 [Phytophthora nicotianae]|uniref:RING-type domain-containing protein n=1 Tax=Phytophthora nicotianae TaxID=4792 RepID=A0A0W8BVV6_PHYNI|nr:hypothetical protein AM587_10015652 [Phytophthora nicotianae]